MILFEIGENVCYRQAKLFNGKERSIVESDERTSIRDEFAQRLNALLANATDVLTRYRTWRETVQNLTGRSIRKNDGVETITQMAGLHTAIVNGDGRESVLLEYPARPALVNIGCPGAVEANAWLFGRNSAGRCLRHCLSREGIALDNSGEAVACDTGDDRGSVFEG